MDYPKFCICGNDPCTFPNCKTGQDHVKSKEHPLPDKEKVLAKIPYQFTGQLDIAKMFDFFNIVSEDCPLFPEVENPEQAAKRFDRAMITWINKQ